MISLCLLLLLGGPVTDEIRHYDKVVLNNGGVFEGIIREDDRLTVKIALLGSDGTVGGTSIFNKTDIREIIPRHTPRQIYKEQLGKRSRTDGQALFELAEWCAREEVGLKPEAIALTARVLRLDPGNLNLYPLMDTLLSGTSTGSYTTEQKDRDIELVLQARKQGLFLGESFLRAAEVMASETGPATPYFAGAIIEVLTDVREQGTAVQATRAVEKMAAVYLRLDRLDALRTLLADAPAALQAQYRSDIIARLLIRGGPDDVKEAQAQIANLPDGKDKQLLEASMAWQNKQSGKAEELLMAALSQEKSTDIALALALLYALQGKVKTAEAVMDLVGAESRDKVILNKVLGKEGAGEALAAAGADGMGFALLSAEESYATGKLSQAATQVTRLLQDRSLSGPVRGLLWTLAARVSVRAGRLDQGMRQLAYAREELPKEPRVVLALAELTTQQKDLVQAQQHLMQAKQGGAPDSQVRLAEAYLAYSRGDMQLAGTLTERLVADPALSARERAYAARMQRAIWEAGELETWRDDFDRADSQDVLRSWREDENYGIKITVADKTLQFAGTQRGGDGQFTRLSKTVDWDRFARAEFEIQLVDGSAQFGLFAGDDVYVLRVEGGKGGTFNVITARRDQEKVTALTAPWRRRLVHRVTLEKNTDGLIAASVDGERVELERRIRFRRGGAVDVGMFVRAATPGGQVKANLLSAVFFRLAKTR